jgi:hypothetical protein
VVEELDDEDEVVEEVTTESRRRVLRWRSSKGA